MAYKNTEESRQYARDWYAKNKKKRREEADTRELSIREQFQKLKESNPCADCKLFYPYYVMDWDHVGPKTITPGHMLRAGWSWERIQRELAQCQLVCANCHRIRTHQRKHCSVL